jgi:hypothetical protein
VISWVGVQPVTASVITPLPTRANILIRNDFIGNLHLETFSATSQRRVQAPARCGAHWLLPIATAKSPVEKTKFVIQPTLQRRDFRAAVGLWWETTGANADTARSRTWLAIITAATAACRPGLVAQSSRREIGSHRWRSGFGGFRRCALTESYLGWLMRTIRY